MPSNVCLATDVAILDSESPNFPRDDSLPDKLKSFESFRELLASLNAGLLSNTKSSPSRKKTVSFNMECAIHGSDKLSEDVGPLVYDGAEFSAIGLIELNFLLDAGPSLGLVLDSISETLNSATHWQFGTAHMPEPLENTWVNSSKHRVR